MAENKDRTQTLFTVWSQSRNLIVDFEDGMSLVKYHGGAVITIPKFIVHVGNQEFESDDLRKVERWLWNNWVRQEKEAGIV